MRPAALIPLLSLLGAAPAHASGMAGAWQLPVGKVEVSETADGVVGKLAEPDARCSGLAKGAEVLHGTFDDGAFSGELRLCLEGPKCSAKESWLSALLMADAGGARLSGAIERGNADCHAQIPGKGGLVIRRWTPHPAVVDPRARVPAAQLKKAQALIAEAGQLLEQGEAEKARAVFGEALAVVPLAEAYNGVGVTHYVRNEYPEALKSYQEALVVDPEFGDAYYNTACIYAVTGKKDLAFKTLQLAAKNRYHDFSAIDDDPDLRSLHDDPRWQQVKGLSNRAKRKR